MAFAGVSADEVSYIEAHGTGTKLGDPIEISALAKAFSRPASAANQPSSAANKTCLVGSVKSNIGHCESAAGVASLSKVLMQMQHGIIAPSLHSQVVNPYLDIDNTPFTIPQQAQPWQPKAADGTAIARIAGISSFGAGGANCHVIVEEFTPDTQQHAQPDTASQTPVAVVLSAKNGNALQAMVAQHQQFLQNQPHIVPADWADL